MIINVLDYLENAAGIAPDKVAFSDREREITFSQCLYQARTLGTRILEQISGVLRKPIGVFIDRKIDCIPAFFGVVCSGNFYVPFDRELPLSRLRVMMESIQPAGFLGRAGDLYLLEQMAYLGEFIDFDLTIPISNSNEELSCIRSRQIDTDPVYAIFTSGSTGVPKCVVVSHRSIIDLIEHFTAIFEFSKECVFGNQAPFDFDVSVKDIFSTLKNAARMEIIPREKFSFPGELIKHLNERKINTMIWSTSAMRIIANLKGLETKIPHYAKTIMFSGEVMPNKVLNYWRQHLPDARFVNLYGPTEITCNCSYFKVERDFRDDEMLPIGISFPNTEILILNENYGETQLGEIGELCVRGTSLALGYYNNLEETHRVFCRNPLNSNFDELIYRTGDLGWRDESGLLYFVSRKDNQIKHMGHRIELGEVELAVNALDLIEAGCCIHDESSDKILLFYQAPQKVDAAILERLKVTLPRYMLPNKLIHFAALPLNKNGKIDRKKLKSEFVPQTGK